MQGHLCWCTYTVTYYVAGIPCTLLHCYPYSKAHCIETGLYKPIYIYIKTAFIAGKLTYSIIYMLHTAYTYSTNSVVINASNIYIMTVYIDSYRSE